MAACLKLASHRVYSGEQAPGRLLDPKVAIVFSRSRLGRTYGFRSFV